jgi:hypothetical protein
MKLTFAPWLYGAVAAFALLLPACGGGSSATDPAAAVAPSIATPPASASVTEGESATFSVTAGGTPPFSYQWRREGADIAGATDANFTLANTTSADDAAQFSVMVGNAAGSVTSATAKLTVASTVLAPSIVAGPASTTVGPGQSASFEVSATGTAPLNFQWRRNGADIAGATLARYTTAPAGVADDGAAFSVVLSNAAGTVTSSAATLTVSASAPPLIAAQPAGSTVAVGQSASFVVSATGSAPIAYQWLRNGVAIAGATASSYTTPPTTALDDGAVFSATASNAVGSALSEGATLRVGANVAALRFARVVVGWDGFHTLARKADGSVWGWGRAEWGELGATTTATFPTATALAVAGPMVAMAAGRYVSTLVSADGTVSTSGLNRNGVLGNGSPDEHRQYGFAPASVVADAVWVATGNSASVAIRRDGSAWEWGSTLVNPAYGPGGARVGTLSGVVAAALGQGGFKFALLADGSLWFWGRNVSGIAAGATSLSGSATPIKVPGIDNIVSFTSGAGHILAVRADATVWSWGYAAQGQLGYSVATAYSVLPRQVPGLSDVVSVAGGWDHSLALRRDGTVWAWGNNQGGQLCLGRSSATESPQLIPGLTAVTDIAAGQEHSVFARSDGTLWVCGLSINGALGIPGVTRSEVPAQVPGIDLD